MSIAKILFLAAAVLFVLAAIGSTLLPNAMIWALACIALGHPVRHELPGEIALPSGFGSTPQPPSTSVRTGCGRWAPFRRRPWPGVNWSC